jgi:hypothetical protein
MERKLYQKIWDELSAEKPMIFLAGPRQAGKTTLARMVSSTFSNSIYFNWDLVTNKRLLIEKPTFFQDINRKDNSLPLVVFDEIHKYKKWKNYLKGVYDEFSDQYKFLVLGSGRLNIFQKGGDSLAGRYFLFTLLPLTLAELGQRRRPFDALIKNPLELPDSDKSLESEWRQLSRVGGFPEPYLSGKETFYRKWSTGYGQQLIREDIRNLTAIKDVDSMEVLFSLLPSRIGSPLSLASLARDVQVSFNSIRDWLEIFESFFLVFRIPSWGKKISRAITKEKKLYLYDYAHIPNEPEKFENMVALELWRAVSNWNDLGLGDFGLHYVRNKEKEEVDFLLTSGHNPILLVEAKLSDTAPAKSLLKFQSALNVPAVQLVNKPDIHKVFSNHGLQTLVVTASRWLAGLS